MKSFITTFLLCLFLMLMALIIGLNVFGFNFWVIVGVAAFFMAVIIESFINTEKRISALEKRIEELEGGKPKEETDETENIDG